MGFLRLKPAAAVTMLLALATDTLRAAPMLPDEYALKSVFLYNFCHFIEWPATAFASPNEPLTIGIVGEDPFGSLLKEAIAGETYHGRPIQIEHYRAAKDIKNCHLLFVSHSENNHLDAILDALKSKSVVTVGESEEFVERGGMIALVADRKRVRLRINTTAMKAASLDVSSKLLHVADLKS
jgi:YfiR/HmsC-like